MWSTAKFFTCASTLAVISLICLLESWLQISSCSFTYSSRSSCSFLAFSSFVLQKKKKFNNYGSLRDETSQPPLWASKRLTYCSRVTNLCWKARPTICSIRTFTMLVIFNPLTAWDSNLVWMADLEIHSCDDRYKHNHSWSTAFS